MPKFINSGASFEIDLIRDSSDMSPIKSPLSFKISFWPIISSFFELIIVAKTNDNSPLYALSISLKSWLFKSDFSFL